MTDLNVVDVFINGEKAVSRVNRVRKVRVELDGLCIYEREWVR